MGEEQQLDVCAWGMLLARASKGDVGSFIQFVGISEGTLFGLLLRQRLRPTDAFRVLVRAYAKICVRDPVVRRGKPWVREVVLRELRRWRPPPRQPAPV